MTPTLWKSPSVLGCARTEILAAMTQVLESGQFCGGPEVERFEGEFADYCGSRHAIGVANGTEALWLALLACDIGAGDEVITVSLTYSATAEAIRMTGATPIFVDVDEDTLTMNPVSVAAACNARTKAVVPVHLHGRLADMDAINSIAQNQGIHVIEDAAQAHGAIRHGQRAGSFGTLGCFSFYPTKNLGGAGDGGAVVTNSDDLAERIRMLRNHGQSNRHQHDILGWNSRMDDLQAAVLRVGLKKLDSDNEKRRQIAARYDTNLAETHGVITPCGTTQEDHVNHVYPVRVPNQKKALMWLEDQGIQASVHYPNPVHLQSAFRSKRHPEGSLPNTEKVAREMVSLPTSPEIRTAIVDYISMAIRYVSRWHASMC